MPAHLPVRAAAPLLCLALCAALAGCAALRGASPAVTVDLHLAALNDFHGSLEPSKFTYVPARSGHPRTVQAGGIGVLGGALDAFRKEDPDLLLVGSGDLVGASPALSSIWADEPSLVALSRMGLVASALGNHEFDAGPAEVLRLQNGGCASTRPAGACRFAPGFKGAGFTYLAANVVDRATGKTLVPASRIVDVKGVKVGLIGAVLQGTPKHAPPSATQGLDFLDEATSINAELAPLRAQGATAFVVLLHEGGTAKEAFDQPDCSTLAGPVVDIVKKLDPAIRLVISAHSHFGYLCRVDGRLVTQAGSAGHLLTRITLHVDPATRQVAGVDARNVVMDPAVFAPDAPLAAYLDEVEQRSAAVLNRTVARIAGPVDMRQNGAGEAPLGGLVADAMLAATRAQGAVLAMVNLGGIRRELETRPGGAVSFAQAQAVLPFGDHLVTMDLTGAQLYAILEQQWDRPADDHPNVLQLSQGAAYRWNPGQAPGRRVLPGSLQLNGVPVDMGKTYRVVTNDYLAEGGSNFPAFKLGTARTDTRIADLDAFIAYLAAHPQVGSGAWAAAAPRIRTAP